MRDLATYHRFPSSVYGGKLWSIFKSRLDISSLANFYRSNVSKLTNYLIISRVSNIIPLTGMEKNVTSSLMEDYNTKFYAF